MINIEGIDKAEILAALYNNARPQGFGFLHFDPKPWTTEDARKECGECNGYYDYFKGRVLKVNLKGNELDELLYDRDNGRGAAYNAIKHLLK